MTTGRNIRVLCVPPTHFARLLPHCAGTLERGLQIAGDGIGDVAHRIEDATLQAWIVTDGQEVLATCFTEICPEPGGGKFVAVCGLAGRRIMRWARELSDTMASFAHAEGCSRLLFQGRPGWVRLLPEFRPVGRRDGETVWERRVLQ